jgi:TRAP transporter TAXI family solute receptor
VALGTINVRFKTDQGTANFTRVCGWLAAELRRRAAPDSTFSIWTGTAYKDNVLALGRGEVDVALTTPPALAGMAYAGTGLFTGEAFEHIRTIGCVPQIDRLVLALAADTGLTSFEDIKERQYPLRLSTNPHDGINGVGWGVELVFNAYGFSGEDLQRWGGGIVAAQGPGDALAHCISGMADAVFHEAIMSQGWVTLTETRTMRFLPVRPDILDHLHQQYGLDSAVIPRGKFRGVFDDVPTLDWSNFVIIVSSAMADELAYTLAQLLVETWDVLERQYRHISPERSPVSYPLNPYTAWRNLKAPLHPGSQRYYQERGYMPH